MVEGRCRGQIHYHGKDLLSCAPEERRRLRGREIAMVFQNVEDALHPLYTVLEEVVESILVHGRENKAGALKRAGESLASVGLDICRVNAYPHQLSGGERQRVMIAMALANNPEVLILDEPTASLDALTRGELIEMLRERLKGKISLVITHDLSTAASLSNRTAVLYGGRLVETGRTRALLAAPRHPYTRGLLRAYPGLTATKDLQGIPGRFSREVEGCPFHPRCTQRVEICAREVPVLTGNEEHQIACHRGGIVPLLEVRGIRKSFGPVNVVSGVSFTLYEGETLALVGESGSGKTTLARTLMGLLKAEKGEILLEGEKNCWSSRKLHDAVQLVFQNPRESISHRMNILQAVKEPLDIHKRGSEEEKKARVRQVVGEVELPVDEGFLEKYPHQLSGGEAQRVAIARALVLNPKILIADEPTSALDASVQAKILKLLLKLQENRGLAMLLITHDLALARKVSDRMAVMFKGRIVEEGVTWALLKEPRHAYTRRLLGHASALEQGLPQQVESTEESYLLKGVMV